MSFPQEDTRPQEEKAHAGYYVPIINWNTILNLLLAPPTIFKPAPSLLAEPIEFPDVSFWQGDIVWDIMASRAKNIIIRSSQNTWKDKMFLHYWLESLKRGMRRSIYHFYDGRWDASPRKQAELVISLVKPSPPDGAIWVDWETNYGTIHDNLKGVIAMIEILKAEFPTIPVGIYTGYYFFIANSNLITNASQYRYIKEKKIPLWLAQYGVDSSRLRIPQPWTTSPELHQYGTPVRGAEFGCQSKEIDMNRVLANHSLYSGGVVTPPPVEDKGDTMPTPVTPEWKQVTASMLNIRNSPGATTEASDIGNLPKGTKVLVDQSQPVGSVVWYRIREAINPQNQPVVTTENNTLVRDNPNCWVSGYYLAPTEAPVLDTGEPAPPREIIFTDNNGVKWRSTTFQRVP